VLAVDANKRVPEAPSTVPVKANRVCPTSTVRPWAVVNAVDVCSMVPLRPPTKARVIVDVTRVLGPAVLVVISWLLVNMNVPPTEVGIVADAVGRSKIMEIASSMMTFLICLIHLLFLFGCVSYLSFRSSSKAVKTYYLVAKDKLITSCWLECYWWLVCQLLLDTDGKPKASGQP